jgi:hypothetical protein
MKRYLAILLLLIYTAFSAVAVAQSHRYCSNSHCTEESPLSDNNAPKGCNEYEMAGRHEAHSIASTVHFQKQLLSQHQNNNTKTYFTSSKSLFNLHSNARRATSPVPVYIRHCAFIL